MKLRESKRNRDCSCFSINVISWHWNHPLLGYWPNAELIREGFPSCGPCGLEEGFLMGHRAVMVI